MADRAQQAGVKRPRSEGDDDGESSLVPEHASGTFGAVASTDQHDGAGGSGSTGVGAVGTADQGDLDAPLAFVDRYAEALDVLMPNLANHEQLRRGTDAKLKTPLAGQPPGTGKTVLGRNLPAILRRPREPAGSLEEAAVADRLRTAWCWEGAGAPPVDEALKDTRPENLVVRTLLAAYKDHEDTILKLKYVDPLLVEMKGLVTPDFDFSFDKALAYSIFCASRRLDGSDGGTEDAFMAQRKGAQTASGAVKSVLQERAQPVILVLDDITDLAHKRFAGYFSAEGRSPLYSAMQELSLTLQLLHAIPRCFVFCTGRSLWLSSKALVQATSPMILRPTLLQPLTEDDIAETLRHTKEPSGRPLLESLGVMPEAQEHLVSRVQRLTGGVGRPVQFLLRARQRERLGGAPLLRTARDIDCSLERLVTRLPASAGVVLSIDWAMAKEASETGAAATWINEQAAHAKLLQLFARMLLLDSAFEPTAKVAVGADQLHLSDAAVVFGLSYGPAAAPVDEEGTTAAAGGAAAAPSSRTHLRLIAGEFLCRSLLTASSVKTRPATLTSVQLLATMRCFGGTMRGRPFEMLCADALCFLAVMRAGQPLGTLLPHLNRTGRNEDRLPAVREEGYALRVVALPKAAANARPLDDEAKAGIMRSREQWMGAAVIHTGDLPWLLSEWLLPGCLGVPADAQSGSQDFFLRLSGGVIGFALKAASASAGTDWGSLREELSKAPALPARVPYTLVLWSLHLAAQLKDALGSIDSAVYDHGKWQLQVADNKLVKLGHGDPTAACTFEVAAGTELVIANPHAPSGGGLGELLGASVLGQLQAMGRSTGRLSIAHLTDWMSKTSMAADGAAR